LPHGARPSSATAGISGWTSFCLRSPRNDEPDYLIAAAVTATPARDDPAVRRNDCLKQVFIKNGATVVEDVPAPAAAPGEVLVRVANSSFPSARK
jgi:hypothetical protein